MLDIITSTKPDINKLPGGWLPEKEKRIFKLDTNYRTKYLSQNIFLLENILTASQCDMLIKFFKTANVSEEVSIQGMVDKNSPTGQTGSVRTTGWVPNMANNLWKILSSTGQFGIRNFNNYSSTDFWQNDISDTWRAIGVSPLFRFMKYEKGGQHYAHYDAGYIYPDPNYRTLMSFVLYLTSNKTGATRFIEDGQAMIPIQERNLNDWDRPVKNEEVMFSIQPSKGSILFFDHRICHDVQEYDGAEGDRIIIRGDIIFESVNKSK